MDKSLQTKILLGNALKELVKETSFSKIIVGDIAAKAGMSRKSFYYHFKDKYDLANWVFDWEFGKILSDYDQNRWTMIERLFCYIDSERDYYQRLLRMTGQNCLSEHIADYLKELLVGGKTVDMGRDFCSTAAAESLVAVLRRWLFEYESISAPEACALLKKLKMK